MYIDSKLQSAVRLALGVGAGAVAVTASPLAFAQGERGGTELEEITVTGSRIKRADLDSASPVTVLNREVLLAQGITDVGNLIQRMPSMSGSPIGSTTNNGGDGSVQIDLRGMGVDRTLTLVNGMRTVDAGDYQTIPSNMIERVEILKDGASAVYGADAVAGVVNIITRRDFEGLELTAQTADWLESNAGAQQAIGLVAGKQFDSGNFIFGAEYVDQEQAYQSDTPWAAMQNSYYIGENWGVANEGCEANPTATPVPPGCFSYGSSRIPETRASWYSQGTQLIGTPASQPYEVGLLQAHDNRTYNYAPVNYIQTPYKRTNIFAEAHFDVLENVRFNTMVRSNFRESSQELAPLPYTGGDPYHNGFYNDPATGLNTPYEGISENNYYLRRAVDTYNATGPATPLIYEPMVQPRRRMIETNRRFEQSINQYQVMVGFEGSFSEVDWEVFYNTGKRSRTDVDYGQFSGARLHNALGPSADLDGNGQPECYGQPGTDQGGVDANTIIGGCVPLNMFGGGVVDPVTSKPTTTTVTEDMLAYISADLVDTYITTNDTAGLIFSGEAFEMNGGPMGWAVGYGYWGQTYTYSPDSGKATGAVTGSVGAGTDGSLYNNAVYGEVLLPFYDNGNQSLDVRVGGRYDEWNAFDGKATGQIGVEFQAVESVKLRATAGTVFRAPTINNLYGGRVDSAPTYTDPCIPSPATDPLPSGCAQVGVQLDSQLRARVGGNPDLQPETGTTFTTGVVWNPEFGDSDLSVTLDYWQVDIEDGISSLGVQYTLDQCYLNNDADACAKITRNPDYSINQVLDGDINVADQGAKGVDTEIRWSMDSNVGQWQAAFLWSHLLERTKTQQPGIDEIDLAGRFTDDTAEDGGGYAADKFNVSLQWFRNDFSVGYLAEYISGLDADTFCNCGTGNQPDGTYIQSVESLLYHDLVANYQFESTGTNIAAGVTNLTNEAPPYIEIGFNAGTSPQIYRMFGRGYYFRLTQSFE